MFSFDVKLRVQIGSGEAIDFLTRDDDAAKDLVGFLCANYDSVLRDYMMQTSVYEELKDWIRNGGIAEN